MSMRAESRNITITNAGDSTPVTFPAGTRKFSVKLKNPAAVMSIAATEAELVTAPLTTSAGYDMDNIIVNNLTIFFTSDQAADTLQVLIFKDQ